MNRRQDGPGPAPGRHPAPAEDDLELASVPELLVQLAQAEDGIRAAARAGHPPTAGQARRERAIVEALRRRHGLAFRTMATGAPAAGPAAR